VVVPQATGSAVVGVGAQAANRIAIASNAFTGIL
jgi:hypothetical protein